MKKIHSAYFIASIFYFGVFILLTPSLVFANNTDSDNDGLSDIEEETVYYTDPYSADTDGDGYEDMLEITNGFSPRSEDNERLAEVDSDNDYLNDSWELILGTDIMNPDSDGDLYLDGTEVKTGFNPLSKTQEKLEKLIKVSIEEQRLYYYFDEKLLEEFPISGGLYYTPTPTGVFKILAKVPVKHYGGTGFDFPNTKWNLHFTTTYWRYYIHGAYWHDNFGNPMSHGCVNVSYDNMERLYWFSELGTNVQIS